MESADATVVVKPVDVRPVDVSAEPVPAAADATVVVRPVRVFEASADATVVVRPVRVFEASADATVVVRPVGDVPAVEDATAIVPPVEDVPAVEDVLAPAPDGTAIVRPVQAPDDADAVGWPAEPLPTEPPSAPERPFDDAETIVFAGVLDTSDLDPDPTPDVVVPTQARRSPKSRNNPVMLVGVLTMVVCSVLGLALISRMDNPTPVPGRPVAAPLALTKPTGTEPARPRAVQRLEDHPLLVKAVPLPELTCDLPKFGTTDDQLAAYYTAGVLCLDQAWGPVLKAENLPFEPPQLDASPELANGPCGAAPASEDAVAYYCGRNRMIYMPTGRLRENGGGDRPATHLATLAHEYGHHVQAMTGILRAADLKIVNAGEKTPAGLEMSRRIELQANCFAGMFLRAAGGKGSINSELANRAEEDFQYAMEEAPDKNAHGSPANQGIWASNGYESNSTATCNTYAAPADQVS